MAIFMEMFCVKIESMFAQLEFLCHLAYDVKKLFSVRGKLAYLQIFPQTHVIPRKLRGSNRRENSTSNLTCIKTQLMSKNR